MLRDLPRLIPINTYWLSVLLVLFSCCASPLTGAVTEQQIKDYARTAWEGVDLTDEALEEALSSSYEGIPFRKWITFFVDGGEVVDALRSGDHALAASKARDMAVEGSVDYLLDGVSLGGVGAIAKLAVWPIEHALYNFQEAVTHRNFKSQLELYFQARSFNSYQAIVDLQGGDVLGAEGNPVTKSDQGWLIRTTSYFGNSVPGYTPSSFFSHAEALWQARQRVVEIDGEERTVAGQFRRMATAEAPRIVIDLMDLTVAEGEMGTFSISAEGSAPLSYDWFVNGQAYTGNEPTFSFDVPGTYQVQVSNEFGTVASRLARLTVTPATGVSLTSPGAGATLRYVASIQANAPGATKVEFYVDGQLRATDSAAPFAWSWDTTTAPDGSHQITAKAYAGATLLGTAPTRSIVVDNSAPVVGGDSDSNEPNNSSSQATSLTSGQNILGRISSSTDVDWFRIAVPYAGKIALNLTVPAGLDYDLELFGPDGNYLTGSYQAAGFSEVISATATTAGTYWLRVYGYPVGSGAYSVTESYALTATFQSGSIAIATQPLDTSVPSGASAIFRVSASDALGSNLQYQWQRNGVDLPGATSPTYATHPVTSSQSGDEFSVRITGELGSATSAIAILSVTNPTPIRWTGNVSNNWEDPGNWDLLRLPTSQDIARINSGNVIAGSANAKFTIVSGGSLTITGSIGGNVTVASGSTLVLEKASGSISIYGSLTNSGTVIWKSGPVDGHYSNGAPALISNLSGGVFEMRADRAISNWTAGSTNFSNAGVLRRAGGTGTASINCDFVNAGVIEVESGKLYFGGRMVNSGAVMVASGTAADLAGTVLLHMGSSFSGAGSVKVVGTITIADGVVLSGAGSVEISGNIHGTINGTGLVSDALNGNCTIAGSLTLRNGINGIVAVSKGGTLVLEKASGTIDMYGSLTNSGTVIWNAAPIRGFVSGGNPMQISNLSGGVFEVRPDQSISSWTAGATKFTNAGTLRRTTGTATASINCEFVNTGVIEVETGRLYFGSTATNAGVVTVASGAIAEWSSTTTLQQGSSFAGAGTVKVAGNISLANGVILSGAGTVEISGNITGTINGNGLISNQLSGNCKITGSVTLLNSIGGNVTVASGATLVLEKTTGTISMYGSLTNSGTVIWKTGPIQGHYTNGNPMQITNLNGGVFEVRPDQSISNWTAGATKFTNAGTLRRTTGTATASINCEFVNTGVIEVETGRLYFGSTATNAGAVTVSNGAIAEWSSTTILQPGSSFAGAGTVKVAGNISLADGVILSGAGTVEITGNITGAINGNGLISQGLHGNCSITGSVTLLNSIGGNVTIASGGMLILEKAAGTIDMYGSLTNSGTVIWKTGPIRGFAADGSPMLITNSTGGVFEVRADQTISNWTAGATKFTNAGTLRRTTGTGTAQISCDFVNVGTVEILTGTLRFQNCVQTSGATLISGGILSFGQPMKFAGGLLGGAGTINGSVENTGGLVSPGNGVGTLAINGGYSQAETGSIAFQVSDDAAFDRLVISGTADLGGLINLEFVGGYEPSPSTLFTPMTFGAKTVAIPQIVASDFGSRLQITPAWTTTSLTLGAHLTPYGQWADQAFGANATDPLLAGPLADPDRNNVANILEFAFGMNPGMPADLNKLPRPTEVTVGSDRYLAIQFRRRIQSSGLLYTVFEAADLSTWTPLSLASLQVGAPLNNGDGTETVTVRASTPIQTTPQSRAGFLRLNVSFD